MKFEVLVLALTEGLATFVKNPIPRSKYNLAISSDFSLSLRMIPAFDLHYLIVLQTTDEPSFLGNYSLTQPSHPLGSSPQNKNW